MVDFETQKHIVAFIFLLQEGYFDVEEDDGPPKSKKRKIWVREWLRRRQDADTDTIFTLQRELLVVSPGVLISPACIFAGQKHAKFNESWRSNGWLDTNMNSSFGHNELIGLLLVIMWVNFFKDRVGRSGRVFLWTHLNADIFLNM